MGKIRSCDRSQQGKSNSGKSVVNQQSYSQLKELTQRTKEECAQRTAQLQVSIEHTGEEWLAAYFAVHTDLESSAVADHACVRQRQAIAEELADLVPEGLLDQLLPKGTSHRLDEASATTFSTTQLK
jgi:hypothetical protein